MVVTGFLSFLQWGMNLSISAVREELKIRDDRDDGQGGSGG